MKEDRQFLTPWQITKLLGVILLLASPSIGQETEFPPADLEFFENKIRPLLIEHCLSCHGADEKKVRGGLRLTSREEILLGGDSGEAAVPGDPEDSLLISAVHFDEFEMPPKGKLSNAQIADFEKWVKLGLPDPRVKDSTATQPAEIDLSAAKDFWAFQPIDQAKTPFPDKASPWAKTQIDQFVFNRLEEQGISPNPDTDRASLLRRTHLALTGLPPTESEIRQFAESDNTLETDLANVVDQLLESKGFGERWGRHWLDVARFAESSGGGRSLMFPHAWRYRDYVIDAYNQDKPFDEFIREQIAGDLLPANSHEERSEHLVATGFLALGPTNYEQQDKELLEMEVIDEQVDTIGRAFLALTLGCARCHDHKFDPIPTRDYYAMAGIFKNTQSLVDGNVSSYVERSLATDSEQREQAEYKTKLATLTKQLKEAESKVVSLGGMQVKKTRTPKSIAADKLRGLVLDNTQAQLTGTWTPSVYSPFFINQGYIHDDKQPKGKNKAVFSPELTTGGQYEVRLSYSPGGNRASNVPVAIHHQDGIAKKRINQSQDPDIDGLFVSLGTYRFEANNVASVTITTEDTDGVVIVDSVQFLLCEDEQNDAPASSLAVPQGQAKQNSTSEEPEESAELSDAKKHLESINQKLKSLKQNAPKPSSVAMSVRDVKSPANGHIHIRGSVRNLGEVVQRGFLQVLVDDQAPIIPSDASGRLQLADWIANANHPLTARVYVNRVWRHLFGRGLVETTDNFGSMGQTPSHPELLDYLANEFTQNQWSTKKLIREIILSRTFRLSSDSIATAAEVDPENRLLWRANRRRVDAEVLRDSILAISGQLDSTAGGRTIRKLEQYDLNYTFNTTRRSVYVPAFRNSMLELFEAFDIANPNLVVGNRNTSTLPTQALFLMNSPWVMEQSRASAQRLLDDTNERPNTDSRLELTYLRVLGRMPSKDEQALSRRYLSDLNADNELEVWTSLYHALYASLDFRYVN